MKIKLSFIIPVYNVERYLRECIDSILEQMTEECEIILINDGSTDISGQICDDFAVTNPQIVVVHQENRGPSVARNRGIDNAKGEFLAFVDSDDRIASGSVAYILEWIEKCGADVCFMSGIKFDATGMRQDMGDRIERNMVRGKSREEVLAHLASRPKFSGSACTKILRREFLLSEGIRFPEDGRRAEDLGFCRDCFLKAQTFDALPCPYYEYRQDRRESFTNTVTSKGFWGLEKFVEESVELLTCERQPISEMAKYALSFVAYEYSILLWQYSRFSENEKKAAYDKLKEYQWVMSYAGNRKIKSLGWAIKVVGLSAVSALLDMYMKQR